MNRKLLLFTLSLSLLGQGSYAQYATHLWASAPTNKLMPGESSGKTGSVRIPKISSADQLGRTTTTVIAGTTDNFGSTTSYTILPTGWTAGATSGPGTWHWANMASHAAYQIGAMVSPSSANGWMIFDSDSLGGATSTGPTPVGWLQSPAYNCSGHPYVRLNFSDYFRKFNDSCFVWVSTNPAFTPGSYTVFPVLANNSLPVNNTLPNSIVAHINISSVAANQPAVYIRYVYMGCPGGGYQWMIDDVNLSDMDAVDVSLDKPFIAYYGGTNVGWNSFGAKPARMIDTISPEIYASNLGYTAEPTTTVSATIYRGATSVYSNVVVQDLPVNAVDSLVDYSGVGRLYSNVIGSYSVPFSTTLAGDADVSNNKDTILYNVTDSTWSENVPGTPVSGRVYVHRMPSGTTPAASFSIATQFDVVAGRVDTLSSISVAFHSSTIPGQKVGVQVYDFVPLTAGGSWNYDGSTEFKTLTAADISTSGGVRYTNFVVDYSQGMIVLDGGPTGKHYAAVVKGLNNDDTVALEIGVNPGPNSIVGFVGAYDTSMNDGVATQQFGQGHLPFGYPSTPYIDLNFGKIPSVGITDVNKTGSIIGNAYPDPANDIINLPITMATTTEVCIVLSNAVGQVVSKQTLSCSAGIRTTALIPTKGFPAGVYCYSVIANGMRTSGRAVVAH